MEVEEGFGPDTILPIHHHYTTFYLCSAFFLRCESTSKRLFYPPEKMIVVIFAYIVRLQTPRLQANILQ